jgi:hypothetical protein
VESSRPNRRRVCRAGHAIEEPGARTKRGECRECDNQRQRRYRASPKGRRAHRESVRRYRLTPKGRESNRVRTRASRFSLPNEVIRALLARGVCDICGLPPREGKTLELDHHHGCCHCERSCGACVRGVLCRYCNQKLSSLGDYGWNTASWQYLEQHERRLAAGLSLADEVGDIRRAQRMPVRRSLACRAAPRAEVGGEAAM